MSLGTEELLQDEDLMVSVAASRNVAGGLNQSKTPEHKHKKPAKVSVVCYRAGFRTLQWQLVVDQVTFSERKNIQSWDENQIQSRDYDSGEEIKLFTDLKLILKAAQFCLDGTGSTLFLWEGAGGIPVPASNLHKAPPLVSFIIPSSLRPSYCTHLKAILCHYDNNNNNCKNHTARK